MQGPSPPPSRTRAKNYTEAASTPLVSTPIDYSVFCFNPCCGRRGCGGGRRGSRGVQQWPLLVMTLGRTQLPAVSRSNFQPPSLSLSLFLSWSFLWPRLFLSCAPHETLRQPQRRRSRSRDKLERNFYRLSVCVCIVFAWPLLS